MASRRLPDRPDLQQYRKQAKELFRAFQSGESEALARFRAHHPGARKASASVTLRLTDAQWVLAREHGFDSWPRFVGHLNSRRQAAERSPEAAPVRLQTPTAREVNLGIFLRDDSQILTATEAEPVRLWNAVTGTLLREFGSYSVHAWALKLLEDKRTLFVGCRDGAVRVVDFETEQVAQVLTGHRPFVRALDVTPDLALAISGAAMRDHDLRLWDVGSSRCLQTLAGHRDGIYAVAFDRTRRRALSGSRDTTVRLWDLERGECLAVFEGHNYHVHAVAWASNGREALSCSRDIRLWDVESGRCVRVFDGHTETIRSVAWSPDQRRAVSAAHDRTVRVWDVPTGECLHVLDGHSTGVVNAEWRSDSRIVSCDWNGEVRRWDVA